MDLLAWPHSGFHVHDGVWVAADDRVHRKSDPGGSTPPTPLYILRTGVGNRYPWSHFELTAEVGELLTGGRMMSTWRVLGIFAPLAACGECSTSEGEEVTQISFDQIQVEVGVRTTAILAWDMDRDGHLDLVVSGGWRVVALHGRGDGTSTSPHRSTPAIIPST